MKKLALLLACVALLLAPVAARAQGQSIGTTPLLDLVAAAKGKVVVLNFFASSFVHNFRRTKWKLSVFP